MLTQTAEYALRAAVLLADRHPDATPLGDLTDAARVPGPYLSKVMTQLVRAGLVRSRRGVGGGYTLAVPPTEVTILTVVDAVDPVRRIETCPLDLPSHGVRLCPLHARLDRAIAGVREALGSATLADLLAEPTDSPPLCDAAERPGPPPAG
ncbi:Rrf2 family transcriptional regulator [Alienimonas sp. DA493]|uniref:Rrf2 family transcriptional regulator n=1 Tax=Alienimonas sp. DA493 TaxID=3373605 RepID=UPI003753EFE8